MEWQPIATAPKDGTWILLAGGECEWDEADLVKRPVSAQWTNYLNGKINDRFARWQFCWYDGGYYGKYENPTHWMPLPPLPKNKE